MTVFNITVTSLPPLLMGLFERDIPERLIQYVGAAQFSLFYAIALR
jgi:hypothetical protein